MAATGIKKLAVTGGFQFSTGQINFNREIGKTILNHKPKKIILHGRLRTQVILQKMSSAIFDIICVKKILSQFTQAGKGTGHILPSQIHNFKGLKE